MIILRRKVYVKSLYRFSLTPPRLWLTSIGKSCTPQVLHGDVKPEDQIQVDIGLNGLWEGGGAGYGKRLFLADEDKVLGSCLQYGGVCRKHSLLTD